MTLNWQKGPWGLEHFAQICSRCLGLSVGNLRLRRVLEKQRKILSMAAFLLRRGCLSTPSQRLALAKIFSLHRLHLFAKCSKVGREVVPMAS
jgi:hypothetical protein